MKNNTIKLAIAGALAFASLNAIAEDAFTGSWYAVPGVSAVRPDSDLETNHIGPGVFIRLGKELSEHWDIQGGVSYATAGANQDRLSTATGIAGSDGRYHQTLVGVDALYMFSRDKFRPFLLAGLGYARNDVDYTIPGINFDGTKNSWMANVGLGAQYLINDTFGLQADLRYVWSRAGFTASNAAASIGNDQTIGNTYLNLGAVFRFGAPKPAAVVEPTPEPVAAVVEPTPEPAPAPAPAPVAAPEPCKPTVETITISAEQLFGFDKAVLKASGKQALDEAADKIKQHGDIEFVMVTGHTDRIGSAAYNQKLSERRANAVKKYLVSRGVDANRLKAVGKGKSEPVVDCKGVKGKKLIECLAPNRRVVIDATHQQEAGCTQ